MKIRCKVYSHEVADVGKQFVLGGWLPVIVSRQTTTSSPTSSSWFVEESYLCPDAGPGLLCDDKEMTTGPVVSGTAFVYGFTLCDGDGDRDRDIEGFMFTSFIFYFRTLLVTLGEHGDDGDGDRFNLNSARSWMIIRLTCCTTPCRVFTGNTKIRISCAGTNCYILDPVFNVSTYRFTRLSAYVFQYNAKLKWHSDKSVAVTWLRIIAARTARGNKQDRMNGIMVW